MDKLVKELIKPILENNSKIDKVVGIYGGRFQPFGPHHLKTYKWLTKQVDEAYITTSNIKKPPRHPMNFREKVRHMTNMGVPSNRIIEEKSPYVAKNLANKYNEDTTVFVYVFGAKDAGRLGGGGKYFQDYKKNKKDLKGFIEHGYYLVAPHVSISVGGKEVSGTTMRELLGSDKFDDKKRKKLFKDMFGYFNQGVYNMMTNKFKKLFESGINVVTWDNTKAKPKDPKWFDGKNRDILMDNVTSGQLSQVEKYLDKIWGKVGIDVEFTRHFMDRLNDKRNEKPINSAEVLRIFKQTYKKYGKQISKLGKGAEALLKDMSTNVNVPFALHWNGKELELRAKTIMRKKNFKSSNKKFAVESIKLPIKVGDTILMGRFKNKKVVIKSIDYNDKGDLLINGRPALKFRVVNLKEIDESVLQDFISKINLKSIIKETSITGGTGADSGPAYAYGNFRTYRTRNLNQTKKLGWDIVNYILTSGDEINTKEYRNYPEGPVQAVSYAPAGVGGGLTPNNQFDLVGDEMLNAYQSHIDKVATTVGMKMVDYLYGIDPDLYRLSFPDTEETKKESEIETPPDSKKKTKKEQHSEPIEVNENTFSKKWWETNLTEELVTKTQLKPRKKDLLLMGGAYGHMAHPFDNKNLTFGDLKQIIELGLGGQLNREDNVTEKLDGQNIMISWRDGKLIAARNKGHIKNGGANALDTKGIGSKFAGRGNIADAFNFAMKDLEKAIKGLSQKQKDKIFNNGYNFMNMEVMWPASSNVIDYDVATLVFHGALQYNDNGDVVGEVPGSGRMLQGMIQQINQHIQKKYSIGKPQFLEVPKHQDFGVKKKYFFNKLQKLQSQYGLKNNDTLSLYHQHYWQELIYNMSKQLKYKIPKKVLVGLTKRWAFFDKKYAVRNMKKDIKNEEFLNWALKYDSNDHKSQVKENMKPFEVLFFEVGAEILKNVKGFIAANPDKAVQGIKNKLTSAISNVKSGGDIKKLNTLKLQLDKLQSIGGMDSIVPSEGLVFKYKGNTYKFTGAFAPINQITGLISF